ncbi:MAG: hypothetical protein Kow0092_16550 [Deferrisomatales bacterium]
MIRVAVATVLASILATLLGGCALLRPAAEAPALPYRFTDAGTVVYREEFEFLPPPERWRFVQVEKGEEFSFAFLALGDCPRPCQSVFAYDEEPFGYSRDLRERMAEFFRRFLWAARVRFDTPVIRPVRVLGGEGLEAVAVGRDPVKPYKVRAKVVLGRRGERVVAFYLSQWRRADAAFDPEEVADFDRFVQSFRYRRPSFYETL